MRALLLRLRLQHNLFYLVGTVVAPFIVASSMPGMFETSTPQWTLMAGRAAVVGAITVGVCAVVALRYRRSSRVPPLLLDALPAFLSEHRDGFCLLLRTFGQDGHVLLPRAGRSGQLRDVTPWTPQIPAEEIIARTMRHALGFGTVGIVDQGVLLAPPGPTFRRVSNDQWRPVAARLIDEARVIVVLLGPERREGAGLQWEIDRIRALGARGRVVIALPAPRLRRREAPDPAAAEHACALLRRLRGSSPGQTDFVLLPSTITVAYGPASRVDAWGVGANLPLVPDKKGRPVSVRRPVSDRRYGSALEQALLTVHPHSSISSPRRPDGDPAIS